MRVRATRGIRFSNFYGNYFIRGAFAAVMSLLLFLCVIIARAKTVVRTRKLSSSVFDVHFLIVFAFLECATVLHYNNLFSTGTDLLALPNCTSDSSFSLDMAYDETVLSAQAITIQVH